MLFYGLGAIFQSMGSPQSEYKSADPEITIAISLLSPNSSVPLMMPTNMDNASGTFLARVYTE